MAVTSPLLGNAPSKLTGDWFSEKEGVFSTMMGVNAGILGLLLGFLVPEIFVKPSY